jgi:hypothetical protein
VKFLTCYSPMSTFAEVLDWLDLVVQADQAEHEALDVLHQVVEYPQALGVLALLHI